MLVWRMLQESDYYLQLIGCNATGCRRNIKHGDGVHRRHKAGSLLVPEGLPPEQARPSPSGVSTCHDRQAQRSRPSCHRLQVQQEESALLCLHPWCWFHRGWDAIHPALGRRQWQHHDQAHPAPGSVVKVLRGISTC